MSESYYTGSQRCEDCGELADDARAREVTGETRTLCGSCALDYFVSER